MAGEINGKPHTNLPSVQVVLSLSSKYTEARGSLESNTVFSWCFTVGYSQSPDRAGWTCAVSVGIITLEGGI